MSKAERRAEELHDIQKQEDELRNQEAELRIKSLKLDTALKKAKSVEMGINFVDLYVVVRTSHTVVAKCFQGYTLTFTGYFIILFFHSPSLFC